MINRNDFNQSLYYLGAVCKYNHDFAETGKSLRQRSNRTCTRCLKIIKGKYKKANFDLCNERTRLWRKRIALQRNNNLPQEKQCNTCLEFKPVKEFYVEKYSANGLLGHCISCDKKRQDSYRSKHRKPILRKDPELIKENRRKIKARYKKSIKGKLANTLAHHRRKAILKAVESKNYTPTEVLAQFAKFGNQCVYCGSNHKITIDHFIPISKFGADKIENIVPACTKCNSSKNNKSPEIWFKSQPFFSLEKWQFLIDNLNSLHF
jgi:5-methylcytosine-specific restriction endonuclease McrA